MREALGDLAKAAQAACGGRAVGAEKVHITLFFLGNVERHRLPMLENLASRLQGSAFDLTLNVLDYWRHNRIVWTGTTECPRPLQALAASLAGELSAMGFQQEDRPYVPHVTLVRNAKRGPKGIVLMPVRWAVADFALIESVRIGGAARYDVLARWPLLV